MKRICSLTFVLVLLSGVASAQSGSGLLGPNRYIDWSHAGAGTIPSRTTICQTLGTGGQAPTFAQGVTTAQIVSALQACAGTNETVLLNPGTYTMSGTLGATSGNPFPSNVTLRGSGPQQTILTWPAGSSFTNCDGYGATALCIFNGDSNAATYSTNVLQVTSGASPGSTSVTLGSAPSGNVCGNPNSPNGCSGSVSNLRVGSLIAFNQLDEASDNGNWWACGTPWTGSTTTNCSQQGEAGNSWGGRSLTQIVTVTGISGSTVTFTPGLYGPTWSESNAPYATFSSVAPVTGVGIENLQLNTVAAGDIWTISEFFWATNSWMSNIASVNATGSNVGAGTGSARNHVDIASAAHITVQNSYFYGAAPTSEGYGVDTLIGASDNLTQNNIFQHMPAAMMLEDAIGNVFGYNYVVDNFYVGAAQNAGNWQQCDMNNHGAGDNYNLFEGGEGICASEDDIHGTSFANTYFRYYLSGHDPATLCPGGGNSCGTLAKNQNTEALELLSYNRYVNFVANVVGSSYFSVYQNQGIAGNPSSCTNPGWIAIYQLNYADQDLIPFSPACVGSSFTIDNDPLVSSSLMRWGNYDTVNGSVRTNSGETASGASTYPGLVSPSTTWGSYPSLYLSSKPAFLNSLPWPGIGPEITGGNISGVSGHAYHNAAGTCFYGPMGGVNTGASGVLNFDAYAVCGYGTGGTPQAAAPTFSPVSPYSGAATTVTLSSTTPSPTISYCQDTINTCTPSTVGTSVSFSSTGYIRAFTTATGYTQSPTSSWQGTIATSTLAAPTLSPNGSVDAVTAPYFLPASFSLTVTPTIPGGSKGCYTTDGSTPAASTAGTCSHGSTFTSGTLSITANQNLQMLATEAANTNSAVTSVFYNQRNAVLESTCSFNGGNVAITTGSCTLSPNPTAGDGLTCGYAIGNNTSIGTISDNVGGAYLPANPSYYGASTFAASGRVYRTGLPGATTITLNLSGPAQYTGFGCEAYKPASAGVFTLDSTFTQSSPYPNATTGNSSSPALSSITPTNANEIVYGQVLNATYTINPTAGSGFTIVNPLPGSPLLYPEYQIQTTATATTLPFSLSATDQWQEQPTAFYFVTPGPPPPTVIQGVTAIGVTFQ